MSAMKQSLAVLAVFALSALAAPASINDTITSLEQAVTQVQRINILADDSDFVFNFLDTSLGGIVTGAGGRTVAATATNFPAVIGNGMAMTVGFLDPCSINSPHTHPRATEFNFIIQGNLTAGFLAENNARFVLNEVPTLSATIFPKGVIHFEANLGCTPAMFVAAFNDIDPGVIQIAQRFFGLPPDVVGASLGGLGVSTVMELTSMIPDNVILGATECFKRCGITPPDMQPTKQQQPRIPANAPLQGM